MALRIRTEIPDDVPSIHELNALAFPTEAEADLVDALRDNAQPVVSLVAEQHDTIVGHIMFTPVELCGDSSLKIMGLAPMAVTPDQQKRGIGSQLVREGLDRCRDIGAGAVVVLGHPSYYPRFGFTSASAKNIVCEYDVPDEAFMMLELTTAYLSGAEGTIRYHDAFGEAT
ncbi:MAG: GNAT family N-acetyltransferase [Planctomycetota bacterium]